MNDFSWVDGALATALVAAGYYLKAFGVWLKKKLAEFKATTPSE